MTPLERSAYISSHHAQYDRLNTIVTAAEAQRLARVPLPNDPTTYLPLEQLKRMRQGLLKDLQQITEGEATLHPLSGVIFSSRAESVTPRPGIDQSKKAKGIIGDRFQQAKRLSAILKHFSPTTHPDTPIFVNNTGERDTRTFSYGTLMQTAREIQCDLVHMGIPREVIPIFTRQLYLPAPQNTQQ